MKETVEGIIRRIHKTTEDCGRNPGSIRLVAVSKTVPVEMIRDAIENGITILGENFIQEARNKIAILTSYPVSWHFIGHLQTNKAKVAVQLFDLIHSVDSVKLARELDRQAEKIGKTQHILIQVNIGDEPTKYGVDISQLSDLINQISDLNHISVKGLMIIPPYFNMPEKSRPFFSKLRLLRDQIVPTLPPHVSLDELSMGMTGDFEVAIQEGATLVRIGTAIFGKRK